MLQLGTLRCRSSTATWCLQLSGQSCSKKKVPVRIANGSVCTVISALLFWDHPQIGMFILPSYSVCSVSFAACSSWTPRGCYDFNPKLFEISFRVLRHSSLLPHRLHEGDWAHTWGSYSLHLTSWVCDGTHESNTSSWERRREFIFGLHQENSCNVLSGRRAVPGQREACLIASKFSPLKSFNLSRLPLCKPPAHVHGWT